MKGRAEQNSQNHRSAVSSNAPRLLLNWDGIYVFLFQWTPAGVLAARTVPGAGTGAVYT